jgi:hypothetical protein
MSNLLIIGVLPSTAGIGGVSVHVKRLLDFLHQENIDFEFVDYKRSSLLRIVYSILFTKIIHINVSNSYLLLLLVVWSFVFNKKTLVTLHGNFGRYNKLRNTITKWALSLSTIPVLINKESYEICLSFNSNSVLLSAFIPPTESDILHDDIIAKINFFHGQDKIVCSTNAFNVSIDKFQNDIYGIEFLIDFFSNKKKYALIISDPSGNYRKKYTNLNENIYFVSYPHSYFEILKLIDVNIRNTSTDGDALSVKESLYLNKTTLCTDVVSRPSGVLLFKYCDSFSLQCCLDNVDLHNEFNNSIENSAYKFIDLYERLMNCR